MTGNGAAAASCGAASGGGISGGARRASGNGTRLANSLNVFAGSEISLLAPRGVSTPFGTAPRVKRYAVKAIFEMGMSEYDNTIAFLPLKEAQSFFNVPGAVHVLELAAVPEARQVLQTLAKGEPTARLTLQAKAALRRLGK